MAGEHSIMREIKSIQDKIRQAGDAAFAEYDLTGSQAGYLRYILDAGGSISQKDLEKTAGVSHPTIVGVMSRLQEKGFVVVRVDERDRRNRVICLTDQARSVTESLEEDARDLDRSLVNGLTAEELQQLDHCLKVIDRNLETTLNTKITQQTFITT